MTFEEVKEMFKKSIDATDTMNQALENLIQSIYLKGYNEALEQKPRWIPVSERLPDIHNYCMKYLVTDCYGHIHTSLFTESGGKGRWSHSDVIAWMPLPKPYKQEEEE